MYEILQGTEITSGGIELDSSNLMLRRFRKIEDQKSTGLRIFEVDTVTARSGSLRFSDIRMHALSMKQKDMKMLLDGKAIIVTGASSGIGAAAAKLFAVEGATFSKVGMS